MNLASATIYALEVPFVEEFRHTIKARTASDAVIVRVRGADGAEGFGEGLARPYVTGESTEVVLRHLQEVLWPRLAGSELPVPTSAGELSRLLALLSELIPVRGDETVVAYNASRSALELAVVDCALRTSGLSLGDCLPPQRQTVTYSGVITAGSVDGTRKRARQMKVMGLTCVKVKVGMGEDLGRLQAIREVMGPAVGLRIDANGAWSVDEAVVALERMAPFRLEAVEQPIPRGDPTELAMLRWRSPIPIMVDESLVTEADADALIAANACQLFNIRISKCGGLGPSLAIAERAQKAGIQIQVGSQVGETAILSAAGRHVAAWLPKVAFVEGSFGGLLLAQDVSRESVSFGFGGEAAILKGPGLGIEVLEERLRKYARQLVEL